LKKFSSFFNNLIFNIFEQALSSWYGITIKRKINMNTYFFIAKFFIVLFCLSNVLYAQDSANQLMQAIGENNVEKVKKLLESGADSDWTALMFAAMRGDVESVKNLVDAKADVNSKTKDGETPLRRATALEYFEKELTRLCYVKG